MLVGVIAIKPIADILGIHGLECEEDPVPNREDRAVVAVGIGLFPVMVDLVHIRGDEYIADQLVQHRRQGNIGVGKGGEDGQKGLVDHHTVDRRAAEHQSDQEKYASPNAFQWMVAQSRGDIDVVVGVVNDMPTPKQRNLVLNKMRHPSTKQIKHQS